MKYARLVSVFLIFILLFGAISVGFTGKWSPIKETRAQQPEDDNSGEGPQVTVSYEYNAQFTEPAAFGTYKRTISETFTGGADLYSVDGGFEGNSTGSYRYVEDVVETSSICDHSIEYHVTQSGQPDVVVHYQFSIDNPITGGPDTSMYNISYGVVEVLIDDRDEHWVSSSIDCEGNSYPDSGENGSVGFGCFFYALNFEEGGTYTYINNVTSSPPSSGTCILTITPQICEFVTTNYASDHRTEPIANTFSFKNNAALRPTSGALEGNDRKSFEYVATTQSASKGCLKLKVTVDKPELSPLDTNPKAKVTVTATRSDGTKVPNMLVKVQVCTVIGKANTDGHLHDRRTEPCEDGRPRGWLTYQGRASLGEPMELKTDQNGQILLDYEPPWNPTVIKNKKTHVVTWDYSRRLYIAGEEKIIAEKVGDPTVKDEAAVTTKVPNLQPMPNSATCGSTNDYYFVRQGEHDCLFYGTSTTNTAVARIAQAFTAKQDECKRNPGGICSIIGRQGNNVTFHIAGDNKQLRITAMSLPWGGTHDIKGDWGNPHVTHNNGKMIDIGTRDFKLFHVDKQTKKVTAFVVDSDRMSLLWHVISLDSNFGSFAADEGNPFDFGADHFHVNFRN